MSYKRFARVAILLTAFVTIGSMLAFAGWNFSEQGRLEGSLSAISYKRFLVQDLRPKPVPDSRNAAIVLQPWLEMARSLEGEIRGGTGLEKLQDALAAVDRALALPDCVFPIAYEDGISALLPHTPGMRVLANALLLQARVKLRGGDSAGARATVLKMIRFTQLFRQDVTGIAFVDRQDKLALALDVLADTWNPTDAASRGEIRQLVSEVAADLPRHLRDSTEMTVAMLIPMFTGLLEGRKMECLPDRYSWIIFRPIVKRDFSKFIDCMGLTLHLIHTPFPESGGLRASLDRLDRDDPGPIFGWLGVRPFETLYQPHVEMMSRLRMVLTACTLEDYRDRTGAYPAELPNSGNATDPITGKPFKYERTAAGYELKSTAKSWKVPADSR